MSGSAKFSWRAVIVLAVVAAAAGLVVFLLQSSNRGGVVNPPPAHPATATGVRPAPDLTAEIAALEQSLLDLEKSYSETMRSYFAARQKALAAANKDALTKELQDAQRQLADAIENHPRIVALKQAMTQAEGLANAASSNQAVILTQLHAAKQQRETTVKTSIHDIAERENAEKKELILATGKKDYASLTPEEHAKLREIENKYLKESRETKIQFEQREGLPDEKEKQQIDDYKALAETREANDKRYGEVYNSLSFERARVVNEDPALTALSRKVSALNDRRNEALSATPDLAPYLKKLEDLRNQRVQITTRLDLLRRQSAGGGGRAVPARGGPLVEPSLPTSATQESMTVAGKHG